MINFKTGDTVKIINYKHNRPYPIPIGSIGTIIECYEDYCHLDIDQQRGGFFYSELEEIKDWD